MTLKRTMRIMTVVFLIVGIHCQVSCSRTFKTEPYPYCRKYPSYLVIKEILPSPERGEFPWIELYNPLKEKVNASGLEIVIDDTYRYPIPGKLPPVPPKGYVVFQLDGKGKEANSYNHRDKVTVLHSPPGFQKVLDPEKGQIGLYRKTRNGTGEVIGFVSWGAPGSKISLTPERHRIWKSHWFVPTVNNFGDYTPGIALKEGASIGLYPGSKTKTPEDWVIYMKGETTRGEENAIPAPVMFTPGDEDVVRREDIAIRWVGNKNADFYEFQLSQDGDFSPGSDAPILRLSGPFYKPDKTLPEGKYFYRVRLIDQIGQVGPIDQIGRKSPDEKKSEWSDIRKFEAVDLNLVQVISLEGMTFKYQRKDTKLLCLDGCASEETVSMTKHWDNAHPDEPYIDGDHGDKNCVRASISMMVSFYGKTLSQDRIAYFTDENWKTIGDGIPEGDLAHNTAMSYFYGQVTQITDTLKWALGGDSDVKEIDAENYPDFENDDYADAILHFKNSKPEFDDLKIFLEENRPIMTRIDGHCRTLNGCGVDESTGDAYVHILDPASGEIWQRHSDWSETAAGTWVGPVSAPNAREDESSVWTDSDSDGIMDFDEYFRFKTGRFNKDSDQDGVDDKNDIRGYVFDANDANHNCEEIVSNCKIVPDCDSDGLRKEKDPDNDGDDDSDGCEDKNHNGIYDKVEGETCNFNKEDNGLSCDSKPVHAVIVLDRSGSMRGEKYDDAKNAVLLFLDTWLVNPPSDNIDNTKVGLVFFDCSAHFDTGTKLDSLTEAKRNTIKDALNSNAPDYGATSIGRGLIKAMGEDGFDIASGTADNQHRILIVLTDGKENCGVHMDDDKLVIPNLVNGQVGGYVLGIGDETQIDIDKLKNLADILNNLHSLEDLENYGPAKFFLQVLAEAQGLEPGSDTIAEIDPESTVAHKVTVSEGTDRVTFVVAWKTPNITFDFNLINPLGEAVTPDVNEAHAFHRVLAKESPLPGTWTLRVRTERTGKAAAPGKLRYCLMSLEKNHGVHSHFEVKGGDYRIGDPMLLTAALSKDRESLLGAEVRVEVVRPTIGFEQFVTRVTSAKDVNIKPPEPQEQVPVTTPRDMRYRVLEQMKVRVPTTRTTLTLNDAGENGDQIPGDGLYSAYFEDTANDGLYHFRFTARSVSEDGKVTLKREKTISTRLRAPEKSKKKE